MGKKTQRHWGRKGSLYLMKDLNCALASLEASQDMISRREDQMLKAITGLEGGVVASGSTCGVITGDALGLALMHDKMLQQRGLSAEIGVLELVGDYIEWFKKSFGTTHCRERTGVDFYTTKGQLRYLFPGDRVSRCLWHIGKAAQYLYAHQEKALLLADVDESNAIPHCAQEVLIGVRDKTGVGDPLLERLSFVFDGGVGLKGGVCGALVGAIVAINLLFGMDIRDMRYIQTIKAFLIGHLNLLLDKPIGTPEPFAIGRGIVERFRQEAGSIECREIIGKDLKGWDNFQAHLSSSDTCKALMNTATKLASDAIERWR